MPYRCFLHRVETENIQRDAVIFKDKFFHIKGVPRIVDISKKYSNFCIKQIGQPPQEDGKYFLLKKKTERSFECKLFITSEEVENRFVDDIQKKWQILRKEKNEILEHHLTNLDLENFNVKNEMNYEGEKKMMELLIKILRLLEEKSGLNEFQISEYEKALTNLILPHSMQFIGDVLLLNLNVIQELFKSEIAEYFWVKKKCKSIFRKSNTVSHVNRTTSYELLKGDPDTNVVHKEANCKFIFNIESVYFNSKLSGARDELLKYFKKDQVVADLFCGIGPISLRALKKGCHVICNDINPHAIEYLKVNLQKNKITQNYEIHNDCAKNVINSLESRHIDHFVFNLPELSIYFIEHVKNFKNSHLHCFFFCKKSEDPVILLKKEANIIVPSNSITISRNVSPSKNYMYLRIKISEIDFL